MVVLIIMLLSLSLFIVLLVRKGQKLTPEEVVSNYLNASISGRTADAHNLLSSGDKAVESLPEYKARRSLGHGLIAEMIAGKVAFTVGRAEIDNDKATVVATITAPDFKMMMSDVLQAMTGDAFPEKNVEAFIFVCRNITHYLGKYRGNATPMKISTESFMLALEKDGWRICLE